MGIFFQDLAYEQAQKSYVAILAVLTLMLILSLQNIALYVYTNMIDTCWGNFFVRLTFGIFCFK